MCERIKNVCRVAIFCFIGLTVFSCRKDKLKDEKQILEGKWKWIYSTEREAGTPPGYYNIIYPYDIGKTYSVEFLYKGKVKFYENNKELDCHRIIFTQWNKNPFLANRWEFAVALDRKRSEEGFGGTIIDSSNDTLIIGNYFPYDRDPNNGIELTYGNYFVREN